MGRQRQLSARQLLEVRRRARRRGTTKALALIDRTRCPSCGSPTTEAVTLEPALFYFGGYGATRSTTSTACTGQHCTWSLTTEVTEVNPRH